MKSIDNVSYVLLGAVVAAIIFTVSNLLVYQYWWQMALAPIVGAVLGIVAGIWVLKERRLPIRTTWGEFRSATKQK